MQGESKIESLPPYLTVQMVRFFFKRDVQKKSKILRKANPPSLHPTFLHLDITCSNLTWVLGLKPGSWQICPAKTLYLP